MKKYASLLIILAGTCWGSMGVFVRILNGFGVDSMQIVESRCIVAACIIGVIILFYDRSLFKINLRHWWCFFGTGIIGITFFNLCYYITIKASSMAVAAVLLYTAPIFVMIFSAVLFKEAITRRKIIALGLTFVGCAMVSGIFDGNISLTGMGFAIGICAGVGYALYTVFARFALNKGYQPLTVQFYTFLFGAVGGGFVTDFGQISSSVSTYGIAVVLAIFGISCLCTALPNVVYTFGMQHVDNGKTSVMASIEPVVAIILGILMFREIPSAVAACGMVLSLSGIILVNREEK